MAVALNKTRKRDSKILIILMVLGIVFTRPVIPLYGNLHEVFDFAGYFLIGLCVAGRIYTTAFLGGYKNEALIDYGPFSVMRNPLYFFSLCGFTGIALMSNHLVLILAAPPLFFAVYYFLIRREEGFLAEKFGNAFQEYCARVPRLFPRLSRYYAPEVVEMRPRYLLRAFRDNLWWFASLPVIEIVEYAQHHELISPIFLLP